MLLYASHKVGKALGSLIFYNYLALLLRDHQVEVGARFFDTEQIFIRYAIAPRVSFDLVMVLPKTQLQLYARQNLVLTIYLPYVFIYSINSFIIIIDLQADE